MARRLFIAIDLPPECRSTLTHLDPHLPGVPWQKSDKLHLTLSFLGQIEADAGEHLKSALSQLVATPFELEIRGVGTFGDPQPKVLWAGVGDGRTQLKALHASVQSIVTELQRPQDSREFHPHVTLSRLRQITHARLAPFLSQHAGTSFGRFHVHGVVLYASEPGPQGSVYRAVVRQDFRAF